MTGVRMCQTTAFPGRFALSAKWGRWGSRSRVQFSRGKRKFLWPNPPQTVSKRGQTDRIREHSHRNESHPIAKAAKSGQSELNSAEPPLAENQVIEKGLVEADGRVHRDVINVRGGAFGLVV